MTVQGGANYCYRADESSRTAAKQQVSTGWDRRGSAFHPSNNNNNNNTGAKTVEPTKQRAVDWSTCLVPSGGICLVSPKQRKLLFLFVCLVAGCSIRR